MDLIEYTDSWRSKKLYKYYFHPDIPGSEMTKENRAAQLQVLIIPSLIVYCSLFRSIHCSIEYELNLRI